MFKVSQLIADFPVYTTISLSSTNHPLYSFHIHIELAIRDRVPGGVEVGGKVQEEGEAIMLFWQNI